MKFKIWQGLGLGLVLFSGLASATMISGGVSFTGTAGVSSSAIDFYNNPATACTTGPNLGAPGCFVEGAGTGNFALGAGTNGSVMDLTGPVVGPQSVPQFLLFANGVTFDLTSVLAAGNPACTTSGVNPTQGGVTCVPGPGPSGFRLTNGPGPGPNGTGTATTVAVQFTVLANGYTGTSASGFTPYVGIFTSQVAGGNAQTILNQLATNNGTGFFVNAYSANFNPVSSVPEPASMLLMGIGLIGFTFLGRRAARR